MSGHCNGLEKDDRAYISIVFDKQYNFPIEPFRIERKGNRLYGGLHQPTKYGSIRQALYYATSRNTSEFVKEAERTVLIDKIYNWSKTL